MQNKPSISGKSYAKHYQNKILTNDQHFRKT